MDKSILRKTAVGLALGVCLAVVPTSFALADGPGPVDIYPEAQPDGTARTVGRWSDGSYTVAVNEYPEARQVHVKVGLVGHDARWRGRLGWGQERCRQWRRGVASGVRQDARRVGYTVSVRRVAGGRGRGVGTRSG